MLRREEKNGDPSTLPTSRSKLRGRTESDAEAIFWDIRIDDGGTVRSGALTLRSYRDLYRAGRDEHSKVDIPYVGGVKIKDVAARTIKPDGSIVELAKEDIIEKRW